MEKERPPGRARWRFSKEFKAGAVALVLDGDRPVAHVARDLGIGATSLGNWVRPGPHRPRRQAGVGHG
ncbi:transposase [Candidatus Poriferisocius sp.]|uniref:transposase n=1 Tax=Candidatus Poriferisocius sp. TaxID=3101276 RepID=UPI003B010723